MNISLRKNNNNYSLRMIINRYLKWIVIVGSVQIMIKIEQSLEIIHNHYVAILSKVSAVFNSAFLDGKEVR